MDINYMKKIQDWVKLDNTIMHNKEEIHIVSERKKELEDDITSYVEKNKLDNLTLNITDGFIKFSKRTTTQSLSIKVIKLLLDKYSTEYNQNLNIDEICDYLTANLEKKQTISMKRDIK